MEYEYDKMRVAMVIIICILLITIIATVVLFKYNPKVSNFICEDKMLEAKDITLIRILQEINEKGYVDIGIDNENAIRLAPVQVG